jgi:putative iron-regulated protein
MVRYCVSVPVFRLVLAFGLLSTLAVLLSGYGTTATAQTTDPAAVVAIYADIAAAGYADSLTAAQALDSAVDALIANPSAEALEAAKAAWVAARVPYQQTEVFRFGNAIVDDWEGKVNAWPLDEGLIDYVEPAFYGTENEANAFYTANIIASPMLNLGGQKIDAAMITPALIEQFHEIDGAESNVATGYHAIEFLLWGQDLNGTDAGAGARAWTDYAAADTCTNVPCDRRGEYLAAASDLLVSDLGDMATAWAEGGEARAAVIDVPAAQGLTAILTGLGSLAYGELAGERMQLGLMLHDPEEEHDCFSDNTHNSHYYNAVGMRSVYYGRYVRTDGSVIKGPSVAALVASADPALAAEMDVAMNGTLSAMTAMKTTAEAGMAYDQMLAAGNDAGNAVLQSVVDALVVQARSTERVVDVLGLAGIKFEGSDSLDAPDKVFE